MKVSIGSLASRTLIASVLAAPALLLTGCGAGMAAPEGNALLSAGTISGRIMGGNTPVVGSTIAVWAVGTTGYGTGATELAATVTGPNGVFSFNQVTTQSGASSSLNATYGCPSPSTLIYLMASGGDPTSQGSALNYNNNIQLLEAIGPCSKAGQHFYDIDEIASVVSVAALQQYINPITEQVGAPSTTGTGASVAAAQTGITNAFAQVAAMMNFENGVVNATYNPSSTVGTVTATPEVAKINTIADILAACINTTGSTSGTCSTLYSAATPPQVRTATNFSSSYNPAPVADDTLQALLFMLQNPTSAGTQVTSCNGGAANTYSSNIACLYSLVSAQPPFPDLAGAPNDWTIGVTYASPSTQTVSSATVPYLGYPEYLAIDKNGDVWVANSVNTTTGYGGGTTELSPTGGIMQEVFTGQNLAQGPRVPVIDPSGNVWVPNAGSTSKTSTVGYYNTVVEYKPSTSSTLFYMTGYGPSALASDGNGNIFVATSSAVIAGTSSGQYTPAGDVEYIANNAVSGSTASVIYPSGGSYAASAYSSAQLDSNFRLWVTSDSTTLQALLPPATGTTYSILTTSNDVTGSVGVAIDNSNDVFVSNYGSTAADLGEYDLNAGGTAITEATGSPFAGPAIVKAVYTAIDGAGNTWTTGQPAATGALVEAANTGALLSPAATGFLHTYYYPTGVAIDPSGNVWIGSDKAVSATATAANSAAPYGPGGAAAGGYITEILGAAVPVVTPIAAGLPTTAGGTSLLATTPK